MAAAAQPARGPRNKAGVAESPRRHADRALGLGKKLPGGHGAGGAIRDAPHGDEAVGRCEEHGGGRGDSERAGQGPEVQARPHQRLSLRMLSLLKSEVPRPRASAFAI